MLLATGLGEAARKDQAHEGGRPGDGGRESVPAHLQDAGHQCLGPGRHCLGPVRKGKSIQSTQ